MRVLLVEIVTPGTGKPVALEGEVGEVLVTTLNPDYPLDPVRDWGSVGLHAWAQAPAGGATCGSRAGWAGPIRLLKIKGMFIRP